ncbi:MAG: PQQ-dependent sugar dehydrogenase, partial [Mycobacteriaceae bacterium]|nr:PQQ-dependent sugar dehydrogenase [Mycobacteriaceae bacterium]
VLIQGNEVQQKWGFGPGETLKIGPDGKLYWSVGGNPYPWGNSQTFDNVYGKLHRMNLDGSAPSDNPFFNVPQPGIDKTIYAYGVRNPFRFTFLPTGGIMLSDTGSSYWEELNNIQKGSNYGWPITEGNCFSCGYANPAYSYGHLPNDGAESAILSYQQPAPGQGFPDLYKNVVFFGDYNRKDIEAVTFDPSYQTPTSDFVMSATAGTISDLEEGPDGNIYWTSIYDGKVSELSANKASFAPTAVASFTPNAGANAVQFSSNGSSAPYSTQALTYSWDFGDGQTSTSANPLHTYASNGNYTATLTVSNGSQTGKATTTVMVGRTTTATISLPASYNAGQTVNFSCSVCVDSVDGNLPASAYTWQVDLISNGVAAPNWLHENQQPFFGPKSGVTSGSFTVPTDMSQNANTYYHVTLTVVNSAGVATVTTADIKPNLTTWTATTSVSGMPFYVDGVWHNSPYTTQDVVGVQHVLMGQAEDSSGGQNYRMQGWNNGTGTLGENSESFTTTSSPATYTAEYDAAGALPAGWSNADVGSSLDGSGEYSSATSTGPTFYLDGAGADASSSPDQFHYTYETLNGDGSIVARVRYQTNVNPWVKSGVMIKQSASSGAAFVDAFVTPDVSNNTPNLNGVNCVFPANAPGAGCDAPLPAQTPAVGHGVGIQSKNGMTTNSSTSALAGYSSPNKWLKLQRSGSNFTASFSTDGSSWHTIGSTSVSMSGPVTIGLFVSSHDNRMVSSSAFDNVTVTGGSGGGGNDFSISANPNSA